MNLEKQRLVALVSGEGSTMAQIANATKDGKLPRTELVGVISSSFRSNGFYMGFELVRNGKNVKVINPADYSCDEAFGEALISCMSTLNPDVCGLYGYYPKMPGNVLDFFKQTLIINQHCGPINPDEFDFGGSGMGNADRVHAARLIFVRKTKRNFWTDATAQKVAPELDKGRVLKRGRIEILPADTVDSLKQKVIRKEWEVQIEVLHDSEESKVCELPHYSNLVLVRERNLLASIKEMVKYLYPKKHD